MQDVFMQEVNGRNPTVFMCYNFLWCLYRYR